MCIASIEDRTLNATLREQYLAGRNTLLFASGDQDKEAAISLSSCARLADLPGVVSAGPVQFLGVDDIVQLGPRVSVMATTASLVPELAMSDAVVGSELSFDGPRRLGGTLVGGLVAVHGSPIAAGVPTGSSVAVLVDPSSGTAGLCIATLDERQNVDDAIPTLMAALDTTGPPILGKRQVSPQFDPIVDYDNRQGRWFPLVSGLVLGAIGAALLLFRGSEIAAYRLSGTSRFNMLGILMLEQVALVGCYGVAGLCAIATLQADLISPRAVALRLAQGSSAWMLLFPVLAVCSVLRNPIDQAKDR